MAVRFSGRLLSPSRQFRNGATFRTVNGDEPVAPNGSGVGVCTFHSGQFHTDFHFIQFR